MANIIKSTELDDAKSVIGMLKCVTNPREYMEIFGITKEDIIRYRDMVKESKESMEKPNFFKEEVEEEE